MLAFLTYCYVRRSIGCRLIVLHHPVVSFQEACRPSPPRVPTGCFDLLNFAIVYQTSERFHLWFLSLPVYPSHQRPRDNWSQGNTLLLDVVLTFFRIEFRHAFVQSVQRIYRHVHLRHDEPGTPSYGSQDGNRYQELVSFVCSKFSMAISSSVI